jgi:hypothetical protein
MLKFSEEATKKRVELSQLEADKVKLVGWRENWTIMTLLTNEIAQLNERKSKAQQERNSANDAKEQVCIFFETVQIHCLIGGTKSITVEGKAGGNGKITPRGC